MVAEAVKKLIGAYRKGDAEDPDTYAQSIALVLASYPQEVVWRVTDPRTGIQSRSQWLPTVAEVKSACEREMKPLREEDRRKARFEAQMAARAEPVRPKLDWEGLMARFQPQGAGDSWLDTADARGVSDPVLRSRIISHHERRISELAAEWAENPVGTPE